MYKRLLFLCIIVFVSCSKDDSFEEEIIVNPNASAKVIGYLPWYRFSQNDKIEYCKLTHLNIAFANPESDGTIMLPNNSSGITLQNIISTAKSNNNEIKIYISIGWRWHLTVCKHSNDGQNFLTNSQDRSVLVNEIS